jgi:hypothetical protein
MNERTNGRAGKRTQRTNRRTNDERTRTIEQETEAERRRPRPRREGGARMPTRRPSGGHVRETQRRQAGRARRERTDRRADGDQHRRTQRRNAARRGTVCVYRRRRRWRDRELGIVVHRAMRSRRARPHTRHPDHEPTSRSTSPGQPLSGPSGEEAKSTGGGPLLLAVVIMGAANFQSIS